MPWQLPALGIPGAWCQHAGALLSAVVPCHMVLSSLTPFRARLRAAINSSTISTIARKIRYNTKHDRCLRLTAPPAPQHEQSGRRLVMEAGVSQASPFSLRRTSPRFCFDTAYCSRHAPERVSYLRIWDQLLRVTRTEARRQSWMDFLSLSGKYDKN